MNENIEKRIKDSQDLIINFIEMHNRCISERIDKIKEDVATLKPIKEDVSALKDTSNFQEDIIYSIEKFVNLMKKLK